MCLGYTVEAPMSEEEKRKKHVEKNMLITLRS